VTPTQYDAAYAWLAASGLLDYLDSGIPPAQRVFDIAVVGGGTAWFPDADLLIRGPDELPEDALRAAGVLRLKPEDAYARILSAWKKVDVTARQRVGLAGEHALLELLLAGVDGSVEHVAAVSDAYGYDISVRGDSCINLEVKSTARRGRIAIYLSRNEFLT